ncbi:DNA polymerase III subunit delta [Aeromicrobium endophyticum]|uniref:DNA-directed DNA polymerase n=1 Tax=Aeromicrobium endophyticum TaxID=2292704 RepID=A0A371P539_9ACTN|nr:DNA polymerase III subunit delta [Aeromicrobium endophyticum]REK70650.1 DNA polymerase III subunit delta [Aeromicrobium endophyticum]
MASAFGKILLITGNAEFLAERTRAKAVKVVTSEQPDCEVATTTASGLQPGELAGLTSPSLFSDASALVLTELQDLPDVAQAELLAYVAAPSPDIAVVLVHSGGQKGKGLLDKLRKAAVVSEVKVEQPKYERDYARWVFTEVRELGARIDEQAAAYLVAAVGQDLRALAGAADQLVANLEQGAHISTSLVQQYFGGRADVRGYEIADATIDGRIDVALEQARWAESAKVAPVLITTALATGLRSLAKLSGAPDGLRDNELAAHIGAPPFKIRAMRQQLRSWDAAGLAAAISAVAQADLDVKGGAADPAFAVERMVLAVAARRRR